MAAVRVVLADDHSIWRDGVRADLADGFSVVAEATTAEETIAAIRQPPISSSATSRCPGVEV